MEETQRGHIEFIHDCKHEVDLALMQQSLQNIEKTNDQILKKINGIPTDIELHRQSLSRLWKFVYVMCGGVVAAVVTAVMK